MARTRLYPPSVDAGFPQLPETPKGWSSTTFGQVLETVERPVKLESEATYELVTAKRSRGGIVSRGNLLGREILTKTQFETKAGDFLISRRQIIHGACGVVPAELDGAIVSNEYSTLRTRPGLLMDFLRHYSQTPYFQRTCFHASHGVDVEKMIFKLEEWLRVRVDVPSTREQEKIAATLSAFDCVVEASQAVIGQLEVLKDGLRRELLTRGMPDRHKEFRETVVGTAPLSWHVQTVEQIASQARFSCVGGPFGSDLTSKDYQTEGVPVIRGNNLTGHGCWLLEDGFVFVSSSKADALSRNLAYPGDIVFTQRGTLGQVARIREDSKWPRFLLSQSQMKLTVNPAIADADFVVLYFASPIGQEMIKRETVATGIPHINLGSLKSFRLLTPPLEEQRELVAIFAAIDDRIGTELGVLEAIKILKSALLTALLTGEIRVPLAPETP